MGRLERKKLQKRRARLKKSFSLLVVFIFFIGIYSIVQYKRGLFEAASGESKIKASDFNGELPENGQIRILLLGSDSRGEKSARTDSILIAHYNQHNNQPKIVSIMRDT